MKNDKKASKQQQISRLIEGFELCGSRDKH
jgi:hypothetical protein